MLRRSAGEAFASRDRFQIWITDNPNDAHAMMGEKAKAREGKTENGAPKPPVHIGCDWENEQRCPVSREQAFAFLNQAGRAFEMWKHTIQPTEDFIACSLLRHSFSPERQNGFVSQLDRSGK